MTKKYCKYCKNGEYAVPFFFADDDTEEVYYAQYCPMCGMKFRLIKFP